MSSPSARTASSHIVGVDIGGANLKFANNSGQAHATPFAMWRDVSKLGNCLRRHLSEFASAPADCLAVTMTGELADCFATRREGVAIILGHVADAFPAERTHVYSVDGHWLSPSEAVNQPWAVAASNWHALAAWVARSGVSPCENLRLLVDVGSTTVDVIPITDGRVATDARTDRQRLESQQLVYTGYERTAVSAVLSEVVIDDRTCPVMAERFADSLDAYLALGFIEEEPQNRDTADGRSRTRQLAQARLARMVGEDCETLCVASIESLARQVIDAQACKIVQAVRSNLPSTNESHTILFSGHGRSLTEQVCQRLARPCNVVYLEDYVSPTVSRCAPAWAVAKLLADHKRVGGGV